MSHGAAQRLVLTCLVVAEMSLVAPAAPNASAASSDVSGVTKIWERSLAEPVQSSPVIDPPIVIIGTASDVVFGISESTGQVIWRRVLGTAEPARVGQPINCDDETPSVGVLAIPAVDRQRHVVYVSWRSWASPSPASATWRVTALDTRTGSPLPGWPVTIAGSATNDPGSIFNPVTQLQRPGLLLADGQVFLAFGGICNQEPYRGWIAGVSIATHRLHLWTDQPSGAAGATGQGGIWESGSLLEADASGTLFVASGNGLSPPPGPASMPTSALANSVLRLAVDADGSLRLVDRFTPAAGDGLNARDLDLGSGGPTLLPSGFSVPGHSHLLVQTSKSGVLYLLDQDRLGGRDQGRGGADGAVAEAGPYEGALSQPAAWAQGGYIYVTGTLSILRGQPQPTLRAYRVVVAGQQVSLRMVAAAASIFGYASGPPIVTAGGTGSAYVWVIETPAGDERVGELRAYHAAPQRGQLVVAARVAIQNPVKFSRPAIDGDDLVLATASGTLEAFAVSAFVEGPTTGNATGGSIPLVVPMLFAGLLVVSCTAALSWRRRRLAHR